MGCHASTIYIPDRTSLLSFFLLFTPFSLPSISLNEALSSLHSRSQNPREPELMAYAPPNQMRIFVPNPQFVDPRAPPRPPPPPLPPPPPPEAVDGFAMGISGPGYPSPFPFPMGLRFDPAAWFRLDQQRSQMLVQFMLKEGLEPSPEEEMKRRDVVEQLKQLVLAWIKKVAWKHRLPKELISSTTATILPYGSYGLGVHGSDSDIDALCVGPYFATLEEDFFIFLRDILQSRPEVSDIHCVKTAKVPLMRFKFNGISVDFPYAQLRGVSVHHNMELFDPYLAVSDETSLRSLSGVRANQRILELVPNLKSFQTVLRCVKLWARRRGIYSHLLGFLGGIHLAILVALVCQGYPNASISSLMSIFFECFSCWPWPQPVILLDKSIPPFKYPDGRYFMPIMMPCSPFDWCNSNITKSTFGKIKAELQRGHFMTRDIWKTDFDWNFLFEAFPYTKRYRNFVRILLAAPDDDQLREWVGWVKSRFRSLLLKLEMVQGYCDPNSIEYVDHNVSDPNVVFYWGLSPNGSRLIDIDSVREDFMKSVNKDIYSDANSNRCRLELSVVESSQLPKKLELGDR